MQNEKDILEYWFEKRDLSKSTIERSTSHGLLIAGLLQK